jgi:hypothetical protein
MGDHGLLSENPEEWSRISESEYETGDKSALMRMLVACAMFQWKIPKWASEALQGAHMQAALAEIKSWDDVFGKPVSESQAAENKADGEI